MLDINVWEIVLYIINIFILFFFLRWLLYKPISKFLNNRTDSIQKQVNEAAKKQAEAEQMKAKYDEMIAGAQESASQIISDGKTLADEQSAKIIADANTKAQAMIEQAHKRIEEERQTALLEMREEVTGIAIQIAQKVLQREVSRKDNQHIIDEFFEKVS